MKQSYHSNATTNVHIREQISQSGLTTTELAVKYRISRSTVKKWKQRDSLLDKSSCPKRISYSLDDLQQTLIVSIRKTTWLPIDEVWEMLSEMYGNISRSSVYRAFCRNGINKIPREKKEHAKTFKEYMPGYLHLDVTYLPKINGVKYYLFVAIDRATRTVYYKVYDAKTSKNAEAFMKECLEFFPFEITHVLTDNGLEFTNRLLKSKKGEPCRKMSKLDVVCQENNVEHRHTKPFSPQTNGMVERVNGTIKNGTVLKETYSSKDQMEEALMVFLWHYILYRRHGGLRKELNVKTPFNAVEKWYQLKPEIFKETPDEFKNKIVKLIQKSNSQLQTTL